MLSLVLSYRSAIQLFCSSADTINSEKCRLEVENADRSEFLKKTTMKAWDQKNNGKPRHRYKYKENAHSSSRGP